MAYDMEHEAQFPDGESGEKKQNTKNNLDKRPFFAVVGVAVAAILGIGALVGYKIIDDNNKEEANNLTLEGLLRGREFDVAGIAIDVSDNASRLTVDCLATNAVQDGVEQHSVTYYLNENGDAYLIKPSTPDANGQALTEPIIDTYDLSSTQAIRKFISVSLTPSCNYLATSESSSSNNS